MDADIVIWQPEESFKVETENILHKHKLTPYLDRLLYGKVIATMVNGIVVFYENNIINKNTGTWLTKK